MYALVKDGKVIKYPYRLAELRKEFPNVGFPKNPSLEELVKYGMHVVAFSNVPNLSPFQTVREVLPVFENNCWKQTWEIVDFTQEEIILLTAQKSLSVRQERNQKLLDSDWTQGKDISSEISNVWAFYRTALRDVSQQQGFPWEVVWPNPPAN